MAKQSSYTDDVREVKPGGTAGWKPGELAGELHRDDRVPFHVLECTATITATGAGALSDAAIAQFLSGHTLDFTHNLGNGNKPLNPHSKVPFSQLKLLGYNQLEREVKGLANAVTGLKTPLEVGSNTVTFRMVQPLGAVESIAELKDRGMGSEQLLDAKLYIKSEKNPLPSGYTYEGLSVRLIPYTERGNGAHVGMVPEWVTDLAPSNEVAKVLELGRGMTIFVADLQTPLAGTAYPEVQIHVGDALVTPFATPARIFEDYSDEPNSGVTELRVADDVTPLYLVPDTKLSNVRTGPVRIEKKSDVGGWNVGYARFAIDSDIDMVVKQQIRNIARRRTKGTDCLAVSSAALSKTPVDKSQHLAVLGFEVLDSENDARQMEILPGLLIPGGVPNAEVVVHIPITTLNAKAPAWAAAWAANKLEVCASIERELQAYMPTGQTSDRGFGDLQNWTRVEIRKALARHAGVKLDA